MFGPGYIILTLDLRKCNIFENAQNYLLCPYGKRAPEKPTGFYL